MSSYKSKQKLDLGREIRKFFLSSFLVITFIAYVIHERLTNPGAGLTAAPATTTNFASQSTTSSLAATPLPPSIGPISSEPLSTDLPQIIVHPTPEKHNPFKDGTFKGPEVDAYYGLVQVQATIQSGKLSNVQFLEYPSDRRTSVEINSFAVPYLQQEALQVQSARVDIISGATLTSEAFMISLQNALNSAKN